MLTKENCTHRHKGPPGRERKCNSLTVSPSKEEWVTSETVSRCEIDIAIIPDCFPGWFIVCYTKQWTSLYQVQGLYLILYYSKVISSYELVWLLLRTEWDWVVVTQNTVHGCSLCESLRSFCLEQPAKLRRDSKGQWSTDGLFRNIIRYWIHGGMIKD